MKNIRLVLEYDGTAYAGWQRQPRDPSVQQAVEDALEALAARRGALHGSGRTDAGVHALAQVAHFHTDATVPPRRFAAALNAHLPPDIAVRRSEEVDPSFHARLGARAKTYVYTVHTGPQRPALARRVCHLVTAPLDAEAMEEAARLLRGTHDFAAFQASGSAVTRTVRTLSRLEIEAAGPFLHVTAEADGFLYKMVRTLVGTLLAVGRGRLGPADVEEALRSGRRECAGPTAPARGLVLAGVAYEGWRTPGYGASAAGLRRESGIFC